MLVASCPTVEYGWFRPSGQRCWELTFPRFYLPRLLTPRRGNPRVEWMLSHSYECFSVYFGDYMPKYPLPGQRSVGIAAKDLRVEERMRNRLRKLLLEILLLLSYH